MKIQELNFSRNLGVVFDLLIVLDHFSRRVWILNLVYLAISLTFSLLQVSNRLEEFIPIFYNDKLENYVKSHIAHSYFQKSPKSYSFAIHASFRVSDAASNINQILSKIGRFTILINNWPLIFHPSDIKASMWPLHILSCLLSTKNQQ